ncbi:Deoxyuridine 5'-triphosphate nucleotidohydrolase [Buchnera aphidicola (Chaetosiphella stipae setosa)]
MKKIDIKIVNSSFLKDESLVPKYSTSGSAGLDLRAAISKKKKIFGNRTFLIPTGISIHIKNKSLAAIIVPRSGLGHNHGIILGNSLGLIDSDYQGEIMISLWNRSDQEYFLNPGMRIAQIVFLKIAQVKFNIVKNFFHKSTRGKKGFGHTGVK